ncbi:decaprenyl-phosphate phosphoribosyltransferase [Neptuniibacter sp. CAU 1671]|uniref:decaprenyl-phosphate phosphoribosyltransferase n=1 Tax=Neptuniibacter sp. CAU 1671 TaxID=3032593 RepID=UPI0023D97B03|nr:decaprenyl-phosphate phosphoribosyltransferase [Neptuniibacter sp. CAU 1671]MDF2182984.1 decaprenyl-phosphate phosphoribosyltransferase [Neptuniibacter sp. CAU 1671]
MESHSSTGQVQNPLQISALIRLLRPRQWIKNGFVLAPLIFTGLFTDLLAVQHAVLALLLFCLASSAAYIVNDLRDIERDRQHPEKSRKRPLASGEVREYHTFILLALLYLLLGSGLLFLPALTPVIVAYLILNLAYSLYLKHQPVLDIFSIASGFVLRVVAGAVTLAVPLSNWMFVTTFCLALYLAAIKRRQELLHSGEAGRQVLENYSVQLVDRYAEMAATGALLFYSLFVMQEKPQLVITIPLVLFGLFRYWFIVERQAGGESPTDAMLSDLPLVCTVLLWVAISGWVMLGGGL